MAQPLAGSTIELGRDAVAVHPGQPRHAPTLGQVLPDQPVSVLVGPPSPHVVRRHELEAGGGHALERHPDVKLRPVVGRDSPHPVRLRPNQPPPTLPHPRRPWLSCLRSAHERTPERAPITNMTRRPASELTDRLAVSSRDGGIRRVRPRAAGAGRSPASGARPRSGRSSTRDPLNPIPE